MDDQNIGPENSESAPLSERDRKRLEYEQRRKEQARQMRREVYQRAKARNQAYKAKLKEQKKALKTKQHTSTVAESSASRDSELWQSLKKGTEVPPPKLRIVTEET